MSLAESALQFAELGRSEPRPVSLLFDRLSGRRRRSARCQRQRALVLVFPRRRHRRRRTLVPDVGRRPRTLQRVLGRGTGYQVSGAARHIRLCCIFAVLAQRKTVVIVIVVVVAAVITAGTVVCGEISLAVFVMIVQKHFDDYFIRSPVVHTSASVKRQSAFFLVFRSINNNTKPKNISVYIQCYHTDCVSR